MVKSSRGEQLNIRGDRFLVDRLKGASHEDLLGLWTALLDDSGRVATGPAVREMFEIAKRHELFTDGALEVFIAELQSYGGNAAANLVRGAGVTYAEILEDTLDYLGFEGTRNRKVELLENTVVVQQMHRLWNLGTDQDQERIGALLGKEADWASVSAALEEPLALLAAVSFLCESKDLKERIHSDPAQSSGKTTAINIIMAGAWGAFASSRGIDLKGKVSSLASSHRVTLPCINYLVRIRMKSDLAVEAVKPHPESSARIGLVETAADGQQLIVRDATGTELLTMEELPLQSLPKQRDHRDAGAHGVSNLSPMLQALPAMVISGEVSSARYMKVVVNGPLALAKDGDGALGFVRGAKGRIAEQARLFEGDLSTIVNSAAIFNVASMALAQKHLADISARLDEIKGGVDKIKQFQHSQREAEIAGAVGYLRQIAEPVMAGESRAAFEHQLEGLENTLLGIQNHLCADIQELVAKVPALKDEGKFGMSVFRSKLTEVQIEFHELAHQWKLCVAARMMACRILCNFSGTRSTVEARERTVRDDVIWMLGDDGQLANFEANIECRMQDFEAWGDSRIELQARRETVRIVKQATLPSLRSEAALMSTQFNQMLLEARQPIELVLSLQDGRVTEVAAL